ncbi:MAG: 6-bladed beta-propeller [Erythrobacter sp. SCN 62-14]|nr:MAG: 6-bladed beta-propeller [Erythrobacter sp. SCN 62-14]
MRAWWCVAAAAFALTACDDLAPPLPPEVVPRATLDADWPSVPDDAVFAEVTAVDVDAAGNVYVLHRAGRKWQEPFPAQPIAEPTVFVFSPDGALIRQWGAGAFIMPHGLSVDAAGKVWITDVALEQVFRFSPEGEVELVLGEAGANAQGSTQFGRPTDVAFLADRVLIADGYVNTRIAEFDQQGRFLREWGNFNIAHSVAVDETRIYVADRENAKVQVFDHSGKLIESRAMRGDNRPYAIKPLGDGRLAVLLGRDNLDRTRAIVRIYAADGTLETSLDVGVPGTKYSLGHDLAISADGYAYIADVVAARVVRFKLPLVPNEPQ